MTRTRVGLIMSMYAIGIAVLGFGGWLAGRYGRDTACQAQTAKPIEPLKPAEPNQKVDDKTDTKKGDIPTPGMVYVWSLPNQGLQSLVVLNVVDGNTVDAAYLVPVRISLKGTKAPALAESGGPVARQTIDKLLGGQLLTAQLWGIDNKGVIADFWIVPEKEGEKAQWLSDVLLKQGVIKDK